MLRKRQILINTIAPVVQVLVLGAVMVVLYRYILTVLGVAQLGIWSVVLATTSATRLTSLGLSGGVVRYVAKYNARTDVRSVVGVIETATLSVGVLVGGGLLVTYPIVRWLLARIVPPDAMDSAVLVLPYAVASLWISSVSSVYQAGLAGHQRIDLRSILMMAGAGLQLVLAMIWIPGHGLAGLAYAHVSQSGLLLIGSWLLLRRQLPALPILPYRWNRELFSEMVRYGVNFQIIALFTMLSDPITKGLLTAFGGLAMVGVYEMASRMVLLVRSLIASATQVVVPVVADLYESQPKAVPSVYRDLCSVLLWVAAPLYAGVVAGAPLVSELWFGRYEKVFVVFVIMLAAGWFVNTFSLPAYSVNLGTGHVGWNTIGHLAIGVLNAGLGILLGRIYGGWGVACAWMLSLSLGSFVIIIAYHARNHISFRKSFLREGHFVTLSSSIAVTCSLMVYYLLRESLGLAGTLMVVILTFPAILAIPLWQHPVRKRVLAWVE